MSPETSNYIARNGVNVLMCILATMIPRNFSKKLRLKSLKGTLKERMRLCLIIVSQKKKKSIDLYGLMYIYASFVSIHVKTKVK